MSLSRTGFLDPLTALGAAAPARAALYMIPPASALDVTVMGFDSAEGIDAAIEIGYQGAENPMVYPA